MPRSTSDSEVVYLLDFFFSRPDCFCAYLLLVVVFFSSSSGEAESVSEEVFCARIISSAFLALSFCSLFSFFFCSFSGRSSPTSEIFVLPM